MHGNVYKILYIVSNQEGMEVKRARSTIPIWRAAILFLKNVLEDYSCGEHFEQENVGRAFQRI